jgi:hypothetical protein
MEGRVEDLRAKLEQLLNQAAGVAAELHSAEAGGSGIPHFNEIEAAAHQVGRDVSCRIQSRRAHEVAAEAALQAACPDCGELCRLDLKPRKLSSTDGPVEVLEPCGQCDRCRRSFFPSTEATGLG